jgi:hypothetical protein
MRSKLIKLTAAELKALIACASEGFEGLAHDKAAARSYLGGQRGINAAERAIAKCRREF